MKKLFTLLMVTISIACYAQPTITSSVAGAIGDEFSYVNVNTTDFDPGAAGENVTWDFSGISTSGTTVGYTLVDPSTTGEAAEFPGANTASDDGSGGFGFFKITPSEYTVYGVYTPATTISYSDPEEILVFPLTYGTSNSDDLYAEFFSGYDMIRDGSNEMNADGYGTLILPSGTYTNVLRVKIEQDFSDEAVGIPFTFVYDYTLYYWYKAGVKGPLFQYFDLKTDIGGIPSNSESYGINSDVEITGLQDNLLNNKLDIFPNPAVDNIQISSADVNLLNAEIYDLKGSLIISQDLSGHTSTIHVADLTSGIYLLKVLTSEGLQIKTITIQ